MTLPPQRRAELFAEAFAKGGFRGLPPHAAVYGDTQRIDETYSIRFSLKKGSLQLVWDPAMPRTQEGLDALAAAYLNARDSFLRHASARLGRTLVGMSAGELMAVLRMHEAGLVTPTFLVGSDVAVLDPVNLHRGPLVFIAKDDANHG